MLPIRTTSPPPSPSSNSNSNALNRTNNPTISSPEISMNTLAFRTLLHISLLSTLTTTSKRALQTLLTSSALLITLYTLLYLTNPTSYNVVYIIPHAVRVYLGYKVCQLYPDWTSAVHANANDDISHGRTSFAVYFRLKVREVMHSYSGGGAKIVVYGYLLTSFVCLLCGVVKSIASISDLNSSNNDTAHSHSHDRSNSLIVNFILALLMISTDHMNYNVFYEGFCCYTGYTSVIVYGFMRLCSIDDALNTDVDDATSTEGNGDNEGDGSENEGESRTYNMTNILSENDLARITGDYGEIDSRPNRPLEGGGVRDQSVL